ncbi:MAG: 3-phosphoshikimate 1-carboxyvinyltransferase [Alphaproteobacteria bacterium]
MKPFVSSPLVSPGAALAGTVTLPGDKSISHRALMLGALSVGETVVDGLLEGEDVLHTAAALTAFGAELGRDERGLWHIHGRGVGGLAEPAEVLDLGNSGTAARLLMGLAASHPFVSFFTGDASLRRRPMQRVAEPLERMGARLIAREGCRLPLAVVGAAEPLPITYRVPVPSAQVKSAVLLAGLNAPGVTSVVEPVPTRDHSERMLRAFGAVVELSERDDGALAVMLTGQPELKPQRLSVPADISSAAFVLVASLLVPGSRISLKGVGVNPLRCGLLATLAEMGAEVRLENKREQAGEPVADLIVAAGRLEGVHVLSARAPSMIDEYPALAVAAAAARGTSRFDGLAELRVKESDRLSAIAAGLAANGVKVEIEGDSLIVHGAGGPVAGGGLVETRMDHRIAMAFLVLGLGAKAPVTVDDGAMIDTSFPGFVALMNGLGARIAAP